ncbi:MAG: hypothetical protein HOO96_09275 [Polyangiaceae bacterium]|nr:hypothetical protein [Polyangiaceae bacterium]
MAYRDEKEALSARARELEAARTHLSESQQVLGQEAAKLQREADEIARRLSAFAESEGAGILGRIDVASPCSAKWSEMVGEGERERFCLSCDKQVFNISAMARAEAEAFLASRVAGDPACIRFYRRADGTILTGDCPTGVRRRRLRVLGAVALGGSALIGAGAAILGARTTCMAGKPGQAVQQPETSASSYVEEGGDHGQRWTKGRMMVHPAPKPGPANPLE